MYINKCSPRLQPGSGVATATIRSFDAIGETSCDRQGLADLRGSPICRQSCSRMTIDADQRDDDRN